MPACRHSDSTPDSRRVRLCSRLPCGSYGAGSPTAVVCGRELGSCMEKLYSVVEWILAANFCLHIGSFHLCAFFVSCVFGRESAVFPERILISFVFSDVPRAPAPLCDHGLWIFYKS